MSKVALELQPCCGNRSGIGTYTYELAKRLQNDNELEFTGNIFNFLGLSNNTSSLYDISMPIHTQKIMPYGVYRRIWHTLPFSYNNLFEMADLHIFFDYIVPPRIDGKVITTIHDLTFLRYPETMSKQNLRRITQDIGYSIERSNHVIVVSEFTKKEVIQLLGVSPERISVVYNAPSISKEIIEWDKVGTKFKIKKPYLLYVGTIEPRKNIIRIIQAYEQLKNEVGISHQLILAGGMGWNTEEIHKIIDKSLYKEEIVLTGYISGVEKNTLYSNATAFIFPSLYEGFGIPPLEAMHFGCPVVCTNAASLPEVVGNSAELVNPLDKVSIAQGVWNVLFQDGRANELKERGYGRIKNFSWEISSQQLKKICKDVLL